MKKKLQLIAVISVLIINGCKKEQTANSSNTSLKTVIQASRDGKYDVLGFGYDVTGKYADITSARFQVVDMERLNLESPGSVSPTEGALQYVNSTSGSDAVDYASSLTKKVTGTFGAATTFFKGSLYRTDSSSIKTSSKYSYALITQIIRQKSFKVNATKDQLIANLTDKFKNSVNTESPQELVAHYGTHILTNIVLGAKLDINYRSQTNSLEKKNAVLNGGTAGFGNVFSGTTSTSHNESLARTNFNETLTYNSTGGDGTKGLIGEVTLGKPVEKINIANWQSTCTFENAILIDILEEGVMPLYELITNPAKKEALRLYTEKYLKDNTVYVLPDISIYDYYSPINTDHLYSQNNKIVLEDNPDYTNTGIAFSAFKTQVSGTVPVYQYNSVNYKDHIYSTNYKPYLQDSPTYVNEGVAFYAYPTAAKGRSAIYQFNNTRYFAHLYTFNSKSVLDDDNSYKNEGIAFYVPE